MSTREKTDYRKNKKSICEICENLFSKFNGDFISVPNKTCKEVNDLLGYACSDKPALQNVDVSKYLYVIEVNGTTMIRK